MGCASRSRAAVASIAPLALVASLAAAIAPSGAAAAPGIAKAVAVDADGDGRVDGIDVRFGAAVKGKAQKRGRFAFKVAGYRVTSVAKPRARKLRVRVAERPGCDVGLRPKVSYRPRGKAGRLTLANGRPLRAATVDMERRDRRPPALTCAITTDSDGNGRVDAVALTYSKRVRSAAQSGARLPFQVDRYALRGVDRARGRNIVLRLRERATPDTDAVPAVIYRPPRKGRGAVVSAAGKRKRAAAVTFNGTRDGAPPRLLSSRTRDGNGDGRVDAVVGRFSEPVRAAGGAVAVAGARVSGAGRDGDSLSAELAGGLAGDARPSVTWGAGGTLRDLRGNVAEPVTTAAADGVAPVIVAARTVDRGGAVGHVDGVELTFSEPVAHPADGDGSYPLGVTGYAIAAVGAASGSRVEVALREASTPDGGMRPAVGYSRGAGAPVRDGAGNEAAATTFAGTADGVVPKLVGAVTVDADLDGRLDGVGFRFSEPVQSNPGACPGCGFATGELTARSTSAASGTTVKVAVDEPGGEDVFNGSLKPLASYGALSGGTVADAAGNRAPAGSLVAADGAPPVVVDAHTIDEQDPGDGNLDGVVLELSEPADFAGDATAPFPFAAGDGYAVAKVEPAAGRLVTVRLQESAGPDTGSAPAIEYTALGGTTLRDLNGVAHAAPRSYPGLTRDAVPPVFVAARTADRAGAAGKIDAVDLVYSEDVTGTPPVSAFAIEGGRTIDSIAFGPSSVRIVIAEGSTFDTDAKPTVSYTPGGTSDDVADIPQGPGDGADAAPAVSGFAAADGAGPAIVGGATVDADENGVIDRVDAELSEPFAYDSTGGPALALSDGLTVTAVAVDGATGLRLAVAQAPTGNGGLKPTVTALDAGRLTDLAVSANPAREGASAAVADHVAPILIGARAGLLDGSACGVEFGEHVDCVRALWSEAIEQPDSNAAFSFTSADFTLAGPLFGADGAAATDLQVAEADRSAESVLVYTAGTAGVVRDLAQNVALDGGEPVAPACQDTASAAPDYVAPSNGLGEGNPLLTEIAYQTLCAGDDDWFKIVPAAAAVDLLVTPEALLDTEIVGLYDALGNVLAATPEAGGPGDVDGLSVGGLEPGTPYWLHIRGKTAGDEGNYCVDPDDRPGTLACDGSGTNPL